LTDADVRCRRPFGRLAPTASRTGLDAHARPWILYGDVDQASACREELHDLKVGDSSNLRVQEVARPLTFASSEERRRNGDLRPDPGDGDDHGQSATLRVSPIDPRELRSCAHELKTARRMITSRVEVSPTCYAKFSSRLGDAQS